MQRLVLRQRTKMPCAKCETKKDPKMVGKKVEKKEEKKKK
jgi:hypothetical protein